MDALSIQPMDILSRDELRLVIAQSADLYVSIFLPIARSDPKHQHNLIQFGNLLRQAEKSMIVRGVSATAAHDILAPAYPLTEDRSFWANQSDGLAIFAAAKQFRIYRLPLAFEELVVVDTHAHITPLVPLLRDDDEFYVFTLSLAGVHLFHGTRLGLSPVELQGVPASLKESLSYDEFAKSAQFHPGPGRARGTVFYSQGALDDTAMKQEILRYFQQVEHGVRHALRDAHAPLLLAGVAYLLPIYRGVNTYTHVLEEDISVNPDDLRPEELHARAWALVALHFDHARAAALERYQMLRGTASILATSYLRAIIPAASSGRIATLFVAAGQRHWGSFDPSSGVLELHEDASPHDAELLNLAAVQTIMHGGTVYMIAPEQMPDAAPVAAIYRF